MWRLRSIPIVTAMAIVGVLAQAQDRRGSSRGSSSSPTRSFSPQTTSRVPAGSFSQEGWGSTSADSRSRDLRGPDGEIIRIRNSRMPIRLGRITHDTLLVHPVGMPCIRTRPDAAFWGQRDIFGIIQAMARRGSIPVTQVPDDLSSFEDFSQVPAGWRAYGILVPPGGDLKVSLDHPNRGWFGLRMCNKWGELEKGMLQNVIHTFEPVVTYHNHKSKPDWVYVIADDPGWMSNSGHPYRITVERSWPPMVLKGLEPKIVVGIWAATRQREQDTFVEQFSGALSEKPTRP